MRILLAGATGQLGAGLREAAAGTDVELVPVIRPLANRSAGARAQRLLRDAPERALDFVAGDVRLPLWGLKDAQLDELAGRVDAVLNVAAETNWAASPSRLSSVNVLGAINGERLARALRRRHGRCCAYVYASSVHVAGDRIGNIAEAPVAADTGRTAYEQSKWLAEQALLSSAGEAELALGIARVGGLLGSSITGATGKRNSLYLLADHIDRLPARLLPVAVRGRVDMLPRDLAGDLLLRFVGSVVRMASREVQLVHVCAGESAPTTLALMAALRSCDRLSECRPPRPVPAPAPLLIALSQNIDRFTTLPTDLQNIARGLRYLTLDRIFERSRLARLLGGELPNVSIESIVRLAFALSPPRPGTWDSGAPLARFAG